MTETCPYCGREFANTKALGSHIHYNHEKTSQNLGPALIKRSEDEKEQFRILLKGCLAGTSMNAPRDIERVEQALNEIPEGVSTVLDQYRSPFSCALKKEKLLKEVEELLRRQKEG